MALTDENKKPVDDIVDISIDGIKKQKFRINGDPKAIIELNLSDLNIYNRLEKGMAELQATMSEIAKLPDDDELSDKLKAADGKMREWIDYIFDSPVSEVVGKGGTMYDPFNGMFRYEHIIDGLTKLYTNNINAEYKKLRLRLQKHTEKYTTKSTTKRGKKS